MRSERPRFPYSRSESPRVSHSTGTPIRMASPTGEGALYDDSGCQCVNVGPSGTMHDVHSEGTVLPYDHPHGQL